MPIVGDIKNLYSDKEKTRALFPVTKVNAISDESGTGLNILLDEKVNTDDVIDTAHGGTGGVGPISALRNLLGLSLTDIGINVSAGSDLNNYKEPGSYSCTRTVVASQSPIKNYPPVTSGGKVIVMNGYNNNYIYQFFLNGVNNNIYYRSYNPEGEGVWYKWDKIVVQKQLDDKAFAGFGYGEVLPSIECATEANLEEKLNTIISGMDNYTTMQIRCQMSFISEEGSAYILTTVYKHTESHALVVFETINGSTLKKRYYNKEWSPLEWDNPPFVKNVEYRTTERHNGKSVYAKYIEFDSIPASGQKSYQFSPTNGNVVRIEACIINASGQKNIFPYFGTTGTLLARILATTNNIIINVFSDISSHTGFAKVYYTKD